MQLTREGSPSTTDQHSATWSSNTKIKLYFSNFEHFTLRKLSTTCQAPSRRKSLEKKYPDVCRAIKQAIDKEACGAEFEIYDEGRFDENVTNVKKFEETIFQYMKSNVVLVNIFMKEPYCTKILQDVNITW